MSRYYASDENQEYQPVTWWNGHAIYATHFIVLAFVVSMLVTAVMTAVHRDLVLYYWLPFDSAQVARGQVWRLFTYGFVNKPDLSFAFDMLMIAWFGRDVEKFFGRRKFFVLFGGIYLLPVLLLSLAGWWWPTGLVGERGALAVFVAFATLYPSVVVFFNVPAKWMASGLVGIFALMFLAANAWSGLFTLAVAVAFAYAFVRHAQGHFSLPKLRFPQKKPHLRVLPGGDEEEFPQPKSARDAAMAEVDALLDKIARSGIASLSAKELARLDEARATLKKKN